MFLENNFSNADLLNVANANFTPKAAGEAESIRIEIDAEESYTSTTFFAVRAIDEAGNVGDVSNIISILVANGYRMTIEGNVVYSHSNTDDEATEEAVAEEEKKKNLTLIIVMSIAAAVIVTAIIVITIGVKKAKAKKSVTGKIYLLRYRMFYNVINVNRSTMRIFHINITDIYILGNTNVLFGYSICYYINYLKYTNKPLLNYFIFCCFI